MLVHEPLPAGAVSLLPVLAVPKPIHDVAWLLATAVILRKLTLVTKCPVFPLTNWRGTFDSRYELERHDHEH